VAVGASGSGMMSADFTVKRFVVGMIQGGKSACENEA
jgi:hypothetical protein